MKHTKTTGAEMEHVFDSNHNISHLPDGLSVVYVLPPGEAVVQVAASSSVSGRHCRAVVLVIVSVAVVVAAAKAAAVQVLLGAGIVDSGCWIPSMIFCIALSMFLFAIGTLGMVWEPHFVPLCQLDFGHSRESR